MSGAKQCKMQLTIDQLSTEDLFGAMMQDGVLVLPTDLGYAMASITPNGCRKMYDMKNRPESKPSGVLGTSNIFKAITDSGHGHQIEMITYPLGVIEWVNPQSKHVRALPEFGTGADKIGVFINLDKTLTDLAEYAFARGSLVVVTSANKAGEGNCYTFDEIADDIIDRAAISVDGGLCAFKRDRGTFENITTTMIDLTERSFARSGAFESMILEDTSALGLINPDEMNRVRESKNERSWRSMLFLRTYEESTFEKIQRANKADWLVLDFEDGCPDNKKDEARSLAEKYLGKNAFGKKPIAVRLNNFKNPNELSRDFEVNFGVGVKAFITPMLKSVEDFKQYVRLIEDCEKRQNLPEGTYKIIPLIETAGALTDIDQIATYSQRNVAMILGHADYFGNTKAEKSIGNLHWIRMRFVMACRTNGLVAIDTPHEEVKDVRGFYLDTRQAKEVGMDGKVVLHFDQVDHANETFGISRSMRDILKTRISGFEGGCIIKDGKFLAAPIVQQVQNELDRTLQISRSSMNRGPIGKKVSYGLDLSKPVGLGQVIIGPMDVTIDEAWITMWHGLVPAINPLETSSTYCAELGLDGRPVPAQLLVNLALCMLVEPFSESCIVHLGVENVRYLQLAYPGDTVRTIMIIDDIRHSSDGERSIVKSRIVMLNQRNDVILSLKRASLFPKLKIDSEFEVSGAELAFEEYFTDPDNALRPYMKVNMGRVLQRQLGTQLELNPGELLLHDLVRPVGSSAGMLYTTLCKNTHAVHYNKLRHKNNVAVSGGFVLPLTMAIAQRDLKFSMYEVISRTSHVNPLSPNEHLGAMSLITDVATEDGIEEVKVRTFGIRELDVPRVMDGLALPLELCAAELKSRVEVESICNAHMPELAGRVSLVVDWVFWRNAPRFID